MGGLRAGLFAAVLCAGSLAWPADAGVNIELGLPIDCEPGRTCWVLNHVDLDPANGLRDFACGHRTYDGHDGTDFALKDLGAMERGVAVRASAAGTVKGVRDGMADANVRDIGRESLGGKDCGNGVVLDHGLGWETQYCHMRRDSVQVKLGQKVETGQALGLVGMSGFAEFPHVHLTVRRQGKPVDPMTGSLPGEACGGGPGALWKPEIAAMLAYEPILLLNAAFSATAPNRRPGRPLAASPQPVTRSAQFMYVWVDAFGVEPDDELTFKVVAPGEQQLFEHTLKGKKIRPYWFQWMGVKRVSPEWTIGAYRAEITLARGKDDARIVRKITAEAVVY